MATLIGILILLIIVLFFVKFEWGVSLYLLYFFLIPYMNIHLGITLGYNFINMLMLMAFVFNYKIIHNYKISFRPLIPVIVYYLLFLLIMPLQSDTPMKFMISMWRSEAMMNIIFLVVLWNLIVNSKTNLNIFNNVILISIIVACCYGLFLTTTPGFNPYILTISNINHVAFDADEVAAVGDGRIFGRISSVFTHPMTFGLFLGLAAIFLLENFNKYNKFLSVTSLSLVLINVVTCGVRSTIIALCIAVSYYIIKERKLKIVFIIFIIGCVVYGFVQNDPELSNYLGSIIDVQNKKGHVGGSDLDMRLTQLQGALKEMSYNPLAGKGYKWHTYYLSIYEGHPTILYFESLLYVILCDGGILGICIWSLFILLMCRSIKKIAIKSYLPYCSIIYFITFSIITGEYGYMKYFFIFYILILGNSYYSSRKSQSYEE